MVLLNIYNLEDVHTENVVASLSDGNHVIGRGGILNVRDRRVSRKHAVINVSEDNITLTSAHVNPCFFQAAQGKTLTIINKDNTNELGDGDRFGLLPDSLWFRVKINKHLDINEVSLNEQNVEDQINLGGEPSNIADATTVQAESSSLGNSLKRHGNNESNEECNDNKRSRLNVDEGNSSTNNLPVGIDNEHDISTTSRHSGAESPNFQLLLDEDDLFNEENHVNNENLSRESNEQVENNEPEASQSAYTSANLDETAVVEYTSNTSLGEVTADSDDIKADSIKQEDLSIPNSQNSASLNNGVKMEPNNSPQVKQESSSDCNNEIKAEPLTGDQHSTDNVASGSGTRKLRRERCWYAEKCFRKNPHHRETFSHPGDQDYESDPEDDRPLCPFGAFCYRRNIEHRQEYKHLNRPAPKPSNNPVNVQVNLQKGCPYCDHCNNQKSGGCGGKTGYESDPYDDDDHDEGIF